MNETEKDLITGFTTDPEAILITEKFINYLIQRGYLIPPANKDYIGYCKEFKCETGRK